MIMKTQSAIQNTNSNTKIQQDDHIYTHVVIITVNINGLKSPIKRHRLTK